MMRKWKLKEGDYIDISAISYKSKSLNQVLDNNIIQVSGLNITGGGSITDVRIKEAKMLIIYFTLLDVGYRQSLIIQKNFYKWNVSSLKEGLFYIKVDWVSGQIDISPITTSSGKLVGYDLIF